MCACIDWHKGAKDSGFCGRMEKQEMENANGRGKWKWTWKMRKIFARKDKAQTCKRTKRRLHMIPRAREESLSNIYHALKNSPSTFGLVRVIKASQARI